MGTAKPAILAVDDEESIVASLVTSFTREGYKVVGAYNGAEGLKVAEDPGIGLVLLDVWLPGMDGLEVLRLLKEARPSLPVIIMTGHGSIEMAVKATKLGAFDFVEKPFSLDKLILSVERALQISSLVDENRALKQKALKEEALIGHSEAVDELRQKIAVVAPSLGRVLVSGEIGTGKELVARLVHRQSQRAEGPFVVVNCASVPADRFEIELFGEEQFESSFESAGKVRRGAFEQADGGTLFLDNVADMSLAAQARLLKVLQEGEFQRVGGTEPVRVDVRVIAATHRDLEGLIRAGAFREDLYFRLNVLPLNVPPLRDRKEDILELAVYFLEKICRENGKLPRTLQPAAVDVLRHYRWPGNVRELRNILERLAILSPEPDIGVGEVQAALGEDEDTGETPVPGSFKEALRTFERQMLSDALKRHDNNITRAAEQLHMERAQLSRKLKMLGISPSGQEV